MAIDPASYPAERTPEVSPCVFEGIFWTVSQLTHAMQIDMLEATSAPFQPVMRTQQ